MGFNRYLAMTAAEAAGISGPEGWAMAWMACHFSPYATGLSNLPEALPPGAMLILNDRTPMAGHDPERIRQQLLESWEKLGVEALLLDLQRPGCPEAAALCAALGTGMPFPVGVSQLYGAETEGPVFLDPVPPDRSVEAHLAPWQGRELWLDLAAEAICLELTESGCRREALGQVPPVERLNLYTLQPKRSRR